MARRPKYAPKPDANQGKLVKDLHESMPCLVIDVSRFLPTPDILVWAYDVNLNRWRWTLWEVKTETGKLTTTQRKLLKEWPGAILVARSADDILREYGRL